MGAWLNPQRSALRSNFCFCSTCIASPPSSFNMGCQTSKAAAPATAQKAPIAVTEELSPTMQEPKEESVPQLPAEEKASSSQPTVEETVEEVEKKVEAALESSASAADEAKEALKEEVKQEVAKEEDIKEEVKEKVVDFAESAKLELKGLKEEVADVPNVVDTALQGEAKQPMCNLFAMCGA
ncbi:hypothetical protein AK812_SmicGene28169 [Symbiodinium microadriaticum]|uniref:Uncharacterized protein n=2 Tax=Symbiodinium microadriaticum TaxID=2951 RepID=A0A1Q9D590_SYMMI|nr:hypothetical protein AK812_SmicGene28169 [Symbiodinium microadriaticum]